jgi:hypothetical protein
MFAMSVKDVPGWSVTMLPSAIGVPVALTPGLVPQSEVVTAVEVGVGLLLPVLGLLGELPQPASAKAAPATTAMNALPALMDTAREILTCLHLRVVTAKEFASPGKGEQMLERGRQRCKS